MNLEQILQRAVERFDADDMAGAEPFCRQALAKAPANVGGMRLLGGILRRTHRVDEAHDLLRKAVALEPQKAVVWFDLATTCLEAGKLDEAIEHYRRALELDSNLQEAYVNIGGVMERQERYVEARPWLEQAVKLRPNCCTSQYNLGNVHRAEGRIDEAILCYERAVAARPDYAKAHWNLANCLLLKGEFARGWREYGWRELAGEVFTDRFEQPRWQGESLAGKRLVVHAEQGIGDEVIFASCYRELIEMADHVTLVCEPRLEALFRRSFPQTTVYGYRRTADWTPCKINEPFDMQIAAGSVPLYLRQTLESFPRPKSFLVADPSMLAKWRQRYDALGRMLKVGISWRAGGKPSERRKRATLLDDWRELFATAGVTWINLQYGAASDELAVAREELGVEIHDWDDADPLVDMDDFAAKVAALDLVISVGNATVHVAGALGVPALTLLPVVPAWRWFLNFAISPWYPSVRLFRQTVRGRWDEPLSAIAAELRQIAGAHSGAGANEPHSQPAVLTRAPAEPTTAAPRHVRSRDDSDDMFRHVHDPGVLIGKAIPDAIAAAIERHRAGDFAAAESIYRQVLDHAPRHQDAAHLLGVLARQTGRVDLAIASIRRAIAADDRVALFHFNLGNALAEAGKLDEAIEAYRQAVALDPERTDAQMALGVALQHAGRDLEAIEPLEAAVAQEPDRAELYFCAARSLQACFRNDEAIAHLEKAISLQPNYFDAQNALATAMIEDGRYADADAICRAVLSADQDPGAAAHATAQNNLGVALRKLGRTEEAIAAYRQAIALGGERTETVVNLADALHSAGDYAGCEAAYLRGIELAPRSPQLLTQLGIACEEQGRLDDALAYYERALAVDERHATAQVNRGLALLQQGNFAEGWRQYEWRWSSGMRPRTFKQPTWDGSSLASRTILVHGEQGVGDEVMFASCLPDLVAQAGHVVIACDRRLTAIMRRSFPTATVHSVVRGREHVWQVPEQPPIDVQIAAGSVPQFVRRDAKSFPCADRLLAADPDRIQWWREQLKALGPGPKVGIAWRGGQRPQDRRMRWTELVDWSGLLTVPGVEFVNLQYGPCDDDLAAAAPATRERLHSFAHFDPRENLDELAAQIAALDLVISVGNANIHLAGALGTPAWSLLPCSGGWRWLIGRDDTLWYASVRLYRQAEFGKWGEVFERVRRDLVNFALSSGR